MLNFGLPAEEVAIIREQIRRLEDKLKEKEKNRKSKNDFCSNELEKTGNAFYNVDDFHNDEYLCLKYKTELEQLRNVLLTRSFIGTSLENNCVDIGRHFSVQFEDTLEEESFIIAVDLTGKSSVDGYISLESPFAFNVLGKSVGDQFSYKINEREIQGMITNISTQGRVKFIRETPLEYRIYWRPSREHQRELSEEDINVFTIMTPSQLALLNEFKNRRSLECSCLEIVPSHITRILNHYKLVSSIPTIKHTNGMQELNKKIGYGTSFSMELLKKNNTVTKRVEMINTAFTTETTNEYIERFSPLGYHLFGLEENSEFYVPDLNIKGRVYDVDNSPYEARFVTTDPLVYQKRKRG